MIYHASSYRNLNQKEERMKKIISVGVMAALLIILATSCRYPDDNERIGPATSPTSGACNSASNPITIPEISWAIYADGFDDDWEGVAPLSASCFEGGGIGVTSASLDQGTDGIIGGITAGLPVWRRSRPGIKSGTG